MTEEQALGLAGCSWHIEADYSGRICFSKPGKFGGVVTFNCPPCALNCSWPAENLLLHKVIFC